MVERINEEWEIDDDGTLVGRGFYHLHPGELTATRDDLYFWPLQIGAKPKFNFKQFIQAYRVAVKRNAGKHTPAFDEEMLKRTIECVKRDRGSRDLKTARG